jgi:2-amino-4-hydroxy-6-hydroxymethyldihydropteridine diphosphokinase
MYSSQNSLEVKHLSANEYVVMMGGNLGDRVNNLSLAIEKISRLGSIKAQSDVYESEPWGGIVQDTFLNQAIWLESDLDPQVLLRYLLKIEDELGRVRAERNGPRPIDLDILYYSTSPIVFAATDDLPELISPHTAAHKRRFVLQIMVDFMPMLVHPTLERNQMELLSGCDDSLWVRKFQSPA